MQTTIVKWGNSQGIRIPKFLLDSVNLASNDEVEVTVKDDSIIIKKSAGRSRRESIKEIFEGYDGGYFNTEEIDWGEPKGDEAW
jgi:antitoxin MazE